MPKVLVTDTYLTNIGNAIRGKNGLTTQYKPSEMASAIESVVTLDDYLSDNLPASITVSASSLGNYNYLFRGNTKTTYIYFPNLTEINQTYQFYNSYVEKVRFGSLTSISGSMCLNLLSLNTLIVETPSVCVLSSTTLQRTDLDSGESGTGIFVPDSLVAGYKAATNWSEYAGYIYPLSDLEG